MKRHYFITVLLLLAFMSTSVCQEYGIRDTIADAQTIDSVQNKMWRDGAYNFPARPRDMWEFGIHAGHYFADGDIDPLVPAGYGLGIHLRRSINYTISLRGDLFYGQTKGIDPQITDGDVIMKDILDYPEGGFFLHRSYRARMFYANLQGVVNLSNILFHQPRNKWNLYLFAGLGFNVNSTYIDAYDEDGNPYNYFDKPAGDINSSSYRKDVVNYVKDKHDGEYETKARIKDGAWHFNDETPMHAEFQGGFGISRKINNRFNIGIEHQVMASDHDLVDGFVYRTMEDQSNNVDIGHYTSVRLGFNIGDFKTRTEPLYWLNPLDAAYGDIQRIKNRPPFDVTDSDNDGVIDILDQEPNTPAGAPVDIRGRTLDSDGDGYPNHLDAEPYSPPNYDIDSTGKAIVPAAVVPVIPVIPDTIMSEEVVDVPPPPPPPVPVPGGNDGNQGQQQYDTQEIEDIVNKRIREFQTEWYLPMIHFDVNSYYVKPEFFPQLYQISTVLKKNPDMKIVVNGNSDIRGSRSNRLYNTVLSYNRAKAAIEHLVNMHGINRDQLILQYGGSDNPVIPNLPDSYNIPRNVEMQQYVNRRVEFKVATDDEVEMERPEGPEAGNPGPVQDQSPRRP